jgi:multiple antibiotic resistance protein
MKKHRWLIATVFVAGMLALAAVAESEAQTQDQYDQQVELLQQKFEFFGGPSLKNVFVILFLSIGPLGVIPAFAKLTAGADDKLKNRLAFRGFWISAVTIVAVAFVGQGMLANYRISLNALLTATGLILAIVAMRSVLTVYGGGQKADPQPATSPALSMAISPLSFPIILPPHAIAVVLLLMIIGERIGVNVYQILGMIGILMALDLLGMVFARATLKVLRPEFLQVAGVILSVMKLGIGITWIYGGMALEFGSIMRIIGS